MIALPRDVEYNGKLWTLKVTHDGNLHTIDYIRDYDLFPVSFTMNTEDEARGLMLAWLQDNGVE